MMKKWIALLLIAASLLSLFSCGKDGVDVPDGMQLVGGGRGVGYYFFAPEEWAISSVLGVSAAYVSPTNMTSVTLAYAGEKPASLPTYFTEHLSEYTYTDFTVTERDTDVVFGNATEAKSYVMTYTYSTSGGNQPVRQMQILATFGNRLYIFTYTSFDTVRTGDETYYSYYFDKVKTVMEAVTFFAPGGTAESKKEYQTDGDGYLLISDKKTAGFDFYVPADYTPLLESGFVGAGGPDGIRVSMTEATSTGVTVKEYFEARKSELETFVTDFTELAAPAELSFAGAKRAAVYEYKYTYRGTVYRVRQILAVTTFRGYVFTYTAPDAVYADNLTVMEKIESKVALR